MKPQEDLPTDVQDDALSRLLREGAAADDEFADHRTRALVGDMARTIIAVERGVGQPAERPRQRPRRRVALLAAAMLSAVVLSAFAYDTLTARTGWFGNPSHSETDGSEWLRTDAPNYGSVLAGLVPDLPLPAGASWDDEIERLVALGEEEPALQQETGARGGFALYARRAWLTSWMHAYERGDDAAMARAQHVLEDAVDWPEIAAVDGGGLRDSIREQADAARRGDVETLRPWLVSCDGFALEQVR